MGSVVKIAAMVNPTAPARRKASPTLPPAVRVSGLIAMNKVAQLSAKERNARTMIQPCSPIAYSLMNRHDGSSSGLMTCTAASRTRNRAAAAQDTRAAVRELAAVGVVRPFPSRCLFPSRLRLLALPLSPSTGNRRDGGAAKKESPPDGRTRRPATSRSALVVRRDGDHHTAALRHGAATDSSCPWRSSYVLMDLVGGVELLGRRAASWAEPELDRARPRRAPSLRPHRRATSPRLRSRASGTDGGYRWNATGCSARSRTRRIWSRGRSCAPGAAAEASRA